MLGLSTTMNLVLVAVWHVANFGYAAPEAKPLAIDGILNKVETRLSRSDVDAIKAVIRDLGPQIGVAFQRITDARAAMQHDVAVDTYDPAAMHRALAILKMSWDDFLDHFGNELVDSLAHVSPAGRRWIMSDGNGSRIMGPLTASRNAT
jgi:hypothetical protein